MIPTFWNALYCGSLAGLFATLVSIGIESFGGFIGGILGSSPTTIIFAIVGFWPIIADDLSQIKLLAFQKSMFIVCPGMIINGVFLYSWKVLPNLLKQQFNFANQSLTLLLILTVVISYSFWLITASLLVLFYHWVSLSNDVFEGQDISPWLVMTSFPHAYTFIISTLSLLLHLLLGVYGCWHSQPRPKSQTKAAMWVNFVRFFAAGLSIFVAVYLGSLDVTVGAIASLFPAIFGTAMISVWLTSGTAVSLGAVEPLILGCLSVSVYAYLSAFLVPLLHIRTNLWTAIILGSIICYLVSICLVSYPSFLFIRSRTMLNVEVASNMTIVLVDSNENNDPELVTK